MVRATPSCFPHGRLTGHCLSPGNSGMIERDSTRGWGGRKYLSPRRLHPFLGPESAHLGSPTLWPWQDAAAFSTMAPCMFLPKRSFTAPSHTHPSWAGPVCQLALAGSLAQQQRRGRDTPGPPQGQSADQWLINVWTGSRGFRSSTVDRVRQHHSWVP